MSGPHTEDPKFGITDDEAKRFLRQALDDLIDEAGERPVPPPRGLHHDPPKNWPPASPFVEDDDEGVGAESGED